MNTVLAMGVPCPRIDLTYSAKKGRGKGNYGGPGKDVKKPFKHSSSSSSNGGGRKEFVHTKDRVCKICGKKGHMAATCWNKDKGGKKGGDRRHR